MFFERAAKNGRRPALLGKKAGRYEPLMYAEAAEAVREVAAGLVTIGVEPGDRVAIMSYNRPEWFTADLAILTAGAVTVPIYHTSTRAQADRILQRAGVATAFVSRSEKAELLLTCDASMERMISLDPAGSGEPGPCALDYDALRRAGRAALAAGAGRELEKRMAAAGPDDCATIVFTSGTTGEPKGVMLSHRNLLTNAADGLAAQPIGDGDLFLSFLPLSHLFERTIGQFLMILGGIPIAYAESVRSVAADARLLRPTIMLAVPRFLEKVHEKILDGLRSAPAWRKALFGWAMRVGRRRRESVAKGAKAGPALALMHGVADRLVYSRLRGALGGRIRFIVCGGAPLAVEIVEFFLDAGIEILEGYGLSEASPVISDNPLGGVRPGTVGRPFDHVEVRIADGGEIVVRGPSVMLGYYEDPAATAEVMRGGWLHTGDLGALEDGYLRITGRMKDIIVTSGGKNVSPQKIEGLLEADDCIGQIVVYGDGRKYLTALVVPDFHHLRGEPGGEGFKGLSDSELAEKKEVYDFLMKRISDRSADLASFERIKKIVVLGEALTEEKGEVTPTMKVKRDRVTQKYRKRLAGLYGE